MAKGILAILITSLMAAVLLLWTLSEPLSAAGKFVVLKKVQLEGPIIRARLTGSEFACATQGDTGRFAFFTASTGGVLYHLSESGSVRRFHPTLVSGLKGSAVVLDEAHERIECFGSDGNATVRCTLSAAVLAVPFGAPVDMLAGRSSFSEGFIILTERGRFLTVDSEGELVAEINLRELSGRPEAFFARLGYIPGSDEYFAFSPNTGCVLVFTAKSELRRTIELNSILTGDAPFSDIVILADGSMIASRGKRLTHVSGETIADIPVASQFAEDAPLFLDAHDNRLLVYNHLGRMLIGEIQ